MSGRTDRAAAKQVAGEAVGPPMDPTVFDTLDDPWIYLAHVREIPKPDRSALLQRWLDLVAQRNPLEQDSLVGSGKEVFGFRLETVRGELKARDAETDGTRIATSVVGEGWMAEMFYRAGADRSVGFLVHDEATGIVREAASVAANNVTYVPPDSQVLDTVVKLPSGVEEYGTPRDLFQKIQTFVARYVEVGDLIFMAVIATYVLASWLYDKFNALPYLRVIGDFGTGKTRLIETVGVLFNRALFASGATSAPAMFRLIEKFGGALVLDEADFGQSEMEATILKVLTAGYKKHFPVLRAEKTEHGAFDVRGYDTYGPKVIAMRRAFKDPALESRCLSYTMVASTSQGTTPYQLPPEFYEEAQRLRNQLLLWRFRTWRTITINPREALAGVSEARITEVGLPLLACAPTPDVRDAVVRALQGYSEALTEERSSSWEGQILAVLFAEWTELTAAGWTRKPRLANILVKSIVDRLKLDYDLPTATSRSVSAVLRKTLKFAMSTRAGRTPTVVVDGRKGEANWQRLTRLLPKYAPTAPPSSAPLSGNAPEAPALFGSNGTGPAPMKPPRGAMG